MPDTPLNPDALEAAATELFFTITAHKSAADVLGFDWKKLPAATRAPWETASSKVVAAYLSALPKPPEGWEAQAKNFMRVIDRLSAENEALKSVAQPEVNSFDPRALNRRGWTCGCEPGNYDSCDECQSACNELANFLNRPEVKP